MMRYTILDIVWWTFVAACAAWIWYSLEMDQGPYFWTSAFGFCFGAFVLAFSVVVGLALTPSKNNRWRW